MLPWDDTESNCGFCVLQDLELPIFHFYFYVYNMEAGGFDQQMKIYVRTYENGTGDITFVGDFTGMFTITRVAIFMVIILLELPKNFYLNCKSISISASNPDIFPKVHKVFKEIFPHSIAEDDSMNDLNSTYVIYRDN